MDLQLKGFKAYVTTTTEEGDTESYLSGIKAFDFGVPPDQPLKECAILRSFDKAVNEGKLLKEDLQMVHFVTSNNFNQPATSAMKNPVYQFFSKIKAVSGDQFYPLGLNQHMSEVGKILISRKPVLEMLKLLFDDKFAELMAGDMHLWLKVCQIACQPGTINIGKYDARVYIDTKEDHEDGVIFVHPRFWADVIREAYGSNFAKPEASDYIDLIKVNSANPDLVVKGVMQRTHPEYWEYLAHRLGFAEDPNSVDIVLCGNAIKYNSSFEVGQTYVMNQDRFAYHSDSSMARGMYVNVSKQVITRSGMDAKYFLDQVIPPVIKRLGGIMQYDAEEVSKAIGMFSSDPARFEIDNAPSSSETKTTLERLSALQKRIALQGLPPNHPSNAAQVLDLGMTVIRDRLNRLSVEGFHGMGGLSHIDTPGYVYISEGIYERWMRKHGTNDAYLFRMPYLGSYCGKWVKVMPAATDSILLHWEDALQMEGDFDGDQYYLIPSKYFRGIVPGTKPPRPEKKSKAEVTLTDAALVDTIMLMTDAKVGIGQRDYMLCLAYDNLQESLARGEYFEAEEWEAKVQTLQVWEQQAVEGIKHASEGVMTIEEARKLFPSLAPHPYTKFFTNRVLKNTKLYSTRNTPGYIDIVKEGVSSEHSWHPLHPIFEALAGLTFGEASEGWEYWEVVKEGAGKQLQTTVDRATFVSYVAGCRRLKRMYNEGIRLWAGGTNRNIDFGKNILGPIRQKWEQFLEEHKDNPGEILDMHLALAHVAYEPTPNYDLINQMRAMQTSRFQVSQDVDIIGIEPFDHRGMLEGRSTYASPAASVSLHRLLPSSGSLFHHLALPEVARYIFRDVAGQLKEGEFEEILIEGLQELASEGSRFADGSSV